MEFQASEVVSWKRENDTEKKMREPSPQKKCGLINGSYICIYIEFILFHEND